MEEIRDKVAGKLWFTTMDLTAGFNQVELHADSQQFYSMWTPDGVLVPKVLVFGGKSFPSIFQGIMNEVLAPLPEFQKSVFVYIDDVIIASDDLEEHCRLVFRVVQVLSQRGVKLSPGKLRLCMKEALVLGYVVSQAGMRPAEKHTSHIEALVFPGDDDAAIASVLGLLGYHQKWIHDYATLASTIRDKSLPEGQRRAAFDSIKRVLMSEPVVVPFNSNERLVLDMDANDHRVAGVLSHLYNPVLKDGRWSGDEKVIMYISHVFNATQRKWVIYIREAYALMYGLDRCHYHLTESRFPVLVRTDHKPLLWLRHAQSPMVVRWYLQYILDVRMCLEWRKGEEHTNADAMTRMAIDVTSPGVASPSGVAACLTFLMEAKVLSPVLKPKRWLIHANGDELLLSQALVSAGLASRACLVMKPCSSVVDRKQPFDGVVAIPAPEVSVAMLSWLLTECPTMQVALLMPGDLVHLVSPLAALAQERWKSATHFSFPTANLVWVVFGVARTSDRVSYMTARATKCQDAPSRDDLVAETALEAVDEAALSSLGFSLVNGVRVKADGVVYIPTSLQKRLTRAEHLSMAHRGRDVLLHHLAKNYFWFGMRATVEVVLGECVFCVLNHARQSMRHVELSSLRPSKRCMLLGVDFYGPISPPDAAGNRFILTLTDLFHGWICWSAHVTSTAEVAALEIAKWFYLRSPFYCMLSDRAQVFRARVIQVLAQAFGTVLYQTAAYSPYQLGRVEEKHRLLGCFLRSLTEEDHKRWGELMPQASSIYNRSPNSKTGITPFEVEYGYKAWSHLSVSMTSTPVEASSQDGSGVTTNYLVKMKRVITAFETAQSLSNEQREKELAVRNEAQIPFRQFAVGARVAVYKEHQVRGVSQKLLLQWEAPFQVIDKKGTNVYVVKHMVTGELREVSTGNMVKFTPTVEAAVKFYDSWQKPQFESEEIDDLEVPGQGLVKELAVDSLVAMRNVDHPDRLLYILGVIRAIDIDDESVEVHYMVSTRVAKPMHMPVWTHPMGEKRPKGVKGMQLAFKQPGGKDQKWLPFTGVERWSDVVATGLILNHGVLDKGSLQALQGLKPTLPSDL